MILNFLDIVKVNSFDDDYKFMLENFSYNLNSNFNAQFDEFKLEYNANKIEELELFALCSCELSCNFNLYGELESKMMVSALEDALSLMLDQFPVKSELGNFSFTPQVRSAYYQLREIFE